MRSVDTWGWLLAAGATAGEFGLYEEVERGAAARVAFRCGGAREARGPQGRRIGLDCLPRPPYVRAMPRGPLLDALGVRHQWCGQSTPAAVFHPGSVGLNGFGGQPPT